MKDQKKCKCGCITFNSKGDCTYCTWLKTVGPGEFQRKVIKRIDDRRKEDELKSNS